MDHVAVIEHNDYRSLYQAYLEHCNNHDFGSAAFGARPSSLRHDVR